MCNRETHRVRKLLPEMVKIKVKDIGWIWVAREPHSEKCEYNFMCNTAWTVFSLETQRLNQ